MADTEKKGMAVWSVASGENPCRGRDHRRPERMVLSLLLGDERVDKMEVSQV